VGDGGVDAATRKKAGATQGFIKLRNYRHEISLGSKVENMGTFCSACNLMYHAYQLRFSDIP
jgi:hypothetical protein